MAVKKIKICECDICNKKVEKETYLTKIKLPSFGDGVYDMTIYEFIDDPSRVDCCDDCCSKIAKLLAKHIGFYDEDKGKLIIK